MPESPKNPLAAPSCLLPGTVAENCRYLQDRVREVGLTLFETESCLGYTSRDLPPDLGRLGLFYHVHLPLDLAWEQGAAFVFERVKHLLEKVAYLEPDKFVLHPPASARDLEKFARLWIEAGLESRRLLMENIRGHDLLSVWPVIEEYDLGVCLDVGHILAYSQEGLLDVFSLWERVGLVHVYGTEINGKHLGLDSLDEHGIQILRAILDNIPKRTVLLLELFDREKFDYSRDILSKLMKKWGMGLDYPDTGRE
jgi:hypothetical protein